jgi:hypothetical protein
LYKLTDNITLSGTWVYGTGNAVSLAVDKFISYSHYPFESMNPSNDYFKYYQLLSMGEKDALENKNNFRMAAYHRLDFGIQFHKKKKWGERTWEISVYNLYNRRNPFFYYGYTDEKNIGRLKQVSLFPIIPSVTYSFKF